MKGRIIILLLFYCNLCLLFFLVEMLNFWIFDLICCVSYFVKENLRVRVLFLMKNFYL